MTIHDILFVMWINTVPIGVIGMGCFILYLFLMQEYKRNK